MIIGNGLIGCCSFVRSTKQKRIHNNSNNDNISHSNNESRSKFFTIQSIRFKFILDELDVENVLSNTNNFQHNEFLNVVFYLESSTL